MFFALLLADVIGLVMLKLGVVLKIAIIICALVFAVIAAVMFFGHNSRERGRKREEQAAAKIADLQDQVETALSSKNNIGTSSSVH